MTSKSTSTSCQWPPAARANARSGAGWLAGQTEHALTDDVALDLVRARPDRRCLVVEPRALPGPVARVVGRAVPQRRRRAEHGHHRVVQALAHLAPGELHRAALGAELASVCEPGEAAPVRQLEQ